MHAVFLLEPQETRPMESLLPFQSLFAVAAGALILSLAVAYSMNHRSTERRVPARIRRRH